MRLRPKTHFEKTILALHKDKYGSPCGCDVCYLFEEDLVGRPLQWYMLNGGLTAHNIIPYMKTIYPCEGDYLAIGVEFTREYLDEVIAQINGGNVKIYELIAEIKRQNAN